MANSDISPDKAIEIIKKRIYKNGQFDSKKTAPYELWAGSEEIIALVHYLREPVYLIHEHYDKTTFVEQTIIDHKASSPGGELIEYIKCRSISPEEAFVGIKTTMNHQVIPLILILHHHKNGNHYQALRVSQEYYRIWNTGELAEPSMRDRYDTALAQLGLPVSSDKIPIRGTPWKRSSDDDSDYEPSDNRSGVTERQTDKSSGKIIRETKELPGTEDEASAPSSQESIFDILKMASIQMKAKGQKAALSWVYKQMSPHC